MSNFDYYYDPNVKRLTKKIYDKERIGEWAKRVLSIARDTYPIYDSQIGIEYILHDSLSVYKKLNEVQYDIEQTLLTHDEIDRIEHFNFTIEKDSVYITFMIVTKFGNIPIDQEVL